AAVTAARNRIDATRPTLILPARGRLGPLLLVGGVQQDLGVLADGRLVVRVEGDFVIVLGDVAAARAADDGAVGRGEALRMLADPSVVLDRGLDADVLRQVEPHLLQLGAWILEEL